MDETLGLQISNREPPQMSEEDNGFCYFIKKDEVPSDISNETIEDFIVYGVMDRQPLDSLLDLMNSNFIP